jgi:hypothetical protein
MEDCDAIFGTYFHHYPYFGMENRADMSDLESSFDNTYELYLKEFPANFSSKVVSSTALCIGETRDVRTALCIGETRDVRTALCIGETRDVRTALCIGETKDFTRQGSFNERVRPTLNRDSSSIEFKR